jgi:hypothetical protein
LKIWGLIILRNNGIQAAISQHQRHFTNTSTCFTSSKVKVTRVSVQSHQIYVLLCTRKLFHVLAEFYGLYPTEVSKQWQTADLITNVPCRTGRRNNCLTHYMWCLLVPSTRRRKSCLGNVSLSGKYKHAEPLCCAEVSPDDSIETRCTRKFIQYSRKDTHSARTYDRHKRFQ